MGRWAEKWKATGAQSEIGGPATSATNATKPEERGPNGPECSRSSKSSSTPELKAAEPSWLTCFHERRAICLEDGGASEAEAHAVAFWEAVSEWERVNPLPEPQPGCCVSCGLHVPDPVGCEVKDGGRIYRAHDLCGVKLHLDRQEQARAALAAAGISEKGIGT